MRLRAALLLPLILAPSIPAGTASSTPRDLKDTGERFRTPILGREFRVLADVRGTLAFEDPAGRLFDSAEDAVRAEESGLPVTRRVIHPDLQPILDDPARAGEPVRVVLVLRRQPVRDASLVARTRVAPLVEARLARIREALADIAPLRSADPGRLLQLGDRIEEEARLLSPETRAELKSIRAEIHDLLTGMRREILDAARPAVTADQAPIIERVGRVPGGRVLSTSLVLSAVVAEVPAGSLPALAEDLPSLARILPHGVRKAGLDISVGTLGATTWTGAGYDGSSTTKVAVMDTGIDAAHPALSAVIGEQAVFLAVGVQDQTFQDDANSTDDIFGHGSHVGGIVMSRDATYKGVAPGGVLMNAKCGYNSGGGGNLQDGDIMAAGDWAADHGADAVNASFGGGGTTDGSSDLSLWFDALVSGPGVFAAVAAGNGGPGGSTVGIPGDAYNVVTVGSLDDKGTLTHSDNGISSFSSRGPVSGGRMKPDLCAPGSNITSVNYQWEGAAADFVSYNGTSMATPHVAGAAALLLDYAAAYRPEGIKALLLSTTRNTSPYATTPDNNWGFGAADLAAAFTARGNVIEGSIPATGPRFVFVRMPALTTGKRATLCWNRDVSWKDAATPTSYRALANLDLRVYEEADQSARGSSTGSLNSVEQVAVTAPTSFPLLKVFRNGNLPSGQSTAPFAVCVEGTGATQAAVAAPPALTCSLAIGQANVRPGDVFTLDVTLSVGGDLPAFGPSITLELPAGYALESGSLTQTVADIAAGASRTASWSVIAGGSASGVATLGATGKCNSYGEDFTGPLGTLDQSFDVTGPTGTIVVQTGVAAVSNPSVSVAVFATDDATGVAQMRVRNDGGAWAAWTAFAPFFAWSLPTSEGTHVVDVQLMDAAGNLSGVLSDSIDLDHTAPAGSYLLAGGALYLMPWQTLTATTDADDAGGSGVTDFRIRWSAAAPWSDWIPLDGGSEVEVPRPAKDQAVLSEGQFRDGAANPSPASYDAIHLVPANPPSLSEVKTFDGRIKAGGDIDSFVFGALAGDVFSLKIKSAPTYKGGDFRLEADLFDPSGAKVATGRYPEDGKKAGIDKFIATLPGKHWIVLRPAGAGAAVGGTYLLTVKSVAAKLNRRVVGPADPVDGLATFTFFASEGLIASGMVKGPVTGGMFLQKPDGTLVTVAGPKVEDFRFDATGTWILRVPASGPLLVDLKLKPPKRAKVTEAAE